MPFDVADSVSAAFRDMARLDATMLEILAAAHGQTGVISGLAVTPSSGLVLAVASGTARSQSITAINYAGGTVTLGAASNVWPRFDVVVLTSAGAAAVRTGTPAASPVSPTLTVGDVALARVYVEVNDTVIAANQITDLRVVLVDPPGSTVSALDHLADVAIAAPVRHQRLVHDGVQWLNTSGYPFHAETRGASPAASAAANTTAIQNAINDVIAAGGGELRFGPGVFNHNGLTADGRVLLTGTGVDVTLLNNTSPTAHSLSFTLTGVTGTITRAAGVRDLTVCAGGAGSTSVDGTSGIGVLVTGGNHAFYAEHVLLKNHGEGARFVDCWYPHLAHFTIFYIKNHGVFVTASADAAGGGATISHGSISNFGATGTPSGGGSGIYFERGGGIYVDTVDIPGIAHGVIVKPPAGGAAHYGFWNRVLADSPTWQGWKIDGTNAGATITSHEFHDCWGSFAVNGNGLEISGAVDDIAWIGGRLRENGNHGAHILGGTNIRFVGTRAARNSQVTTNTYSGFSFAAGVSEWSLQGVRSGNFASAEPNGQKFGLEVAAGAGDNYQIIGCDFRSNITAALSNGATGTNRRIWGNLPTSIADV